MFEDFEEEETSIPEIRRKLQDAADSYYNNSSSIMSDEEFDNLKDTLLKLSPNDPFFSQVGAPVSSSEWKKEKHKIPMGSLNKVNTEEEFKNWIRQIKSADRHIQTNDLVLSCKLDGISIDLEYEKGKLIKAITRGDGVIGEDIFSNVIRMKNVNSELNGFSGSLRGEIVIHRDDFVKLNIASQKNGDREYKNPRNAASGIAKNFEGDYVEFCTVLYYDITGDFNYEGYKFNTIYKKFGLETAWFIGPITEDELKVEFKKWEENKRENYPYDIDGLCVYLNNCEKSFGLGFTNENPKGKVAWKFSSIKKIAKVIDVVWEVGLNRRITPVIYIEPTSIGGVTVHKMTCHNIDLFYGLKLYKECNLLFERANDVIPIPLKVMEEGKNHFKHPEVCPVCESNTEIDNKYLICPNDGCKALFLGNLQKWVVKLEIVDISHSTIEKLYSAGKIEFPSDFYKLTVKDFVELDGLGEKSGTKILDQFHSKMQIDLPTFIGGLNMSSFSNSQCEKLVKAGYDSLDKLYTLTEEKLCAIPGIKSAIAKKILDGLKQKKKVVDELLKAGITIKAIQKAEVKTVSKKLEGLAFVFTGAIQKMKDSKERYTREDLQRLVVINGGENHTSVNKKTTFLVQADPSSMSTKTKKALALGKKILSEDNFFKMIGE